MISIYCGLNKVIIDGDIVIDDIFSIIKNAIEIEEICNQQTVNSVGTLHYQSLMNKPILLQRLFSREGDQDPYQHIRMFRGFYQHFLLSIWLLKDNSINMEDVVFSDKTKGIILIDKNPVLFSNSQGEYKSVYLTKNEVEESLKWFNLLLPIFILDDHDEKKDSRVTGTRLNNNKDFKYYNFNRLQRATRFVMLARGESFPPAKITFYISALESLFSNSNVELRMQVADRACRVLGDVFEERIRVNKIISIAYSFRSSYIHGSVNNQRSVKKALKPYETIEELSFELDDILRRLLKRFLTDLNNVTSMDDAAFSIWINELLYK